MDAYTTTLIRLCNKDYFYKVWFSRPIITINAAFTVKERRWPGKDHSVTKKKEESPNPSSTDSKNALIDSTSMQS